MSSKSPAFRPLTAEELATIRPAAQSQEEWTPIIPPLIEATEHDLNHFKLGEPSEIFPYYSAAGELEGFVRRFDTMKDGKKDKTFLPTRFGTLAGTTGWHAKGWGENRPPYRLRELLASPTSVPVLITEGERKADCAAALFPDHVAIAPMNGAHSPQKTDWSYLSGRHAIIWPDNDAPGAAFAAQMCRLGVAAGAASVSIVQISENFPPKWDLANDLPEGVDVATLRGMLIEAKAPSVENVPDMSVIRENRRAPPELNLSVFGEFWAIFIRSAAEATAAPPDYVAAALLSAAAALIGNSRWVSPWEGWQQPTVLWIGVVGDPSSGKSPAADPILSLVRRLEADAAQAHEDQMRQYRTGVEAAKAARKAWLADVETAQQKRTPAPIEPLAAIEPDLPTRSRVFVTDATIEALSVILAGIPKGIAYHRDELSGWIGSFDKYGGAGGDRAFWIETYDGRSYSVDRKGAAKTIIIPHLSVSIFGGIQPDRLATALLAGDDDGLPARFLLTWPEKVERRRPVSIPDSRSAELALRRLASLQLGTDDKGNPAPIVLQLSNDAASAFEPWWKELGRRDHVGKLGSHRGKQPGHVLRLASILEHLWWSAAPDKPEPREISEPAILAALYLVSEYFDPMAERCYGDAALPKNDRLTTILARWIAGQKSSRPRPTLINARNLRRSVRIAGLGEAEDIKVAIRGLIEAGWLIESTTTAPGRPKSDFIINSEIWARLP